ncbi:MAG: peptidoglycan DD-metalloendopeptidase family protein [Muribaculaceae bacterium]|nr:peptidoglycan DD-metalloendopeptidase family protein [Muribaculaceae bacterium]
MTRVSRLTLSMLALAVVLPVASVDAQKKKRPAKTKAAVETSADVKRQQETTRQEINRTREQIRLNDREVAKKLADLSKIEGEIASGKVKVEQSRKNVEQLQNEISSLEASIHKEQHELTRLRTEYLNAVKQMRAKKKQMSRLAFIFSSRSFNEAMRRIRYLRQFSRWRSDRSAEIDRRVADLRQQSERLAGTRKNHVKALAENEAAQQTLRSRYAEQDGIVRELKKNGRALREHLAKKQNEANVLKNRVAALIAEEQRKAEAERRAREEAAARQRAAEERQRQEKLLAQQKAEAEQRAREEEKRRREQLLAQEQSEKKDVKPADKAKETKKTDVKPAPSTPKDSKKEQKKDAAKGPKKVNKKGRDKQPEKKVEEVSYAEARGRKPHHEVPKPVAVETPSARREFASMKGSLPRPVSGAFRITSPFGAHSLPDMPNVTYDNPGIDAEVGRGATVNAVHEGTVSGVYVVPGYGTVIILNHNGYYTVYGNIASASVKVGDKVKTGHRIGSAAEDIDNPGHGLLHFEVWKNREKQDPAAWLR